VRENGYRLAQSLVDENLFRCVRQMVISANDMADGHSRVVYGDREVVGSGSVCPYQDEIVDRVRRERNVTPDSIHEGDVYAIIGDSKTPDVWLAGSNSRFDSVGVEEATRPVVTGESSLGPTGLPLRV
jgi:hypothetical protein